MLLTMKMKNTTWCARRFRCLLARIIGRIRSMLAPVVPRMLASTAPSARNAVLNRGEPGSRPEITIPPAITYSEKSRMMNGKNSAAAWCAASTAPSAPLSVATIPSATNPHTAETMNLLRFDSHQWAVRRTRGSTAMARSRAAKGATVHAGRWTTDAESVMHRRVARRTLVVHDRATPAHRLGRLRPPCRRGFARIGRGATRSGPWLRASAPHRGWAR